MDTQSAKVKEKFRQFDTNGDGTLCFEEFLALLKKGNPQFPEQTAEDLFHIIDVDLSGQVEFDEFCDYVFDQTSEGHEISHVPPKDVLEEEAKSVVLEVPLNTRSAAFSAVKQRGQNWSKLSWCERLDIIHDLEEGLLDHPADSAPQEAPQQEESRPITPAAIIKAKQLLPSSQQRKKTTAIADKTQPELVDYSLGISDLQFAGREPATTAELASFKEHLKTAGPPEEVLEVSRFLAKGTAGWVFAATRRDDGSKVALKVVRMTQARTCMKEWYISDMMRRAHGHDSWIVRTAPQVCVLDRSQAPPVIGAELANAGPVPFYVCMLQEFMPGGSLEDAVNENRLPPKMMFKALADVASTLAMLHAMNVQHRDVKPENALLERDGDTVISAKLCDFGSATVGNGLRDRQDDIRRFGVMVFSVATGEGWTEKRLIREKHDAMVNRLRIVVADAQEDALRRLPDIAGSIMNLEMEMKDIAELLAELRDSCAG